MLQVIISDIEHNLVVDAEVTTEGYMIRLVVQMMTMAVQLVRLCISESDEHLEN